MTPGAVAGAVGAGAGTGTAGEWTASSDRDIRVLAEFILHELVDREATVAAAESLTGGLLTAALTAVPGSSAAVLGGVVAYANQVKHRVLGVDGGLLDRVGPVHPEVAGQMAQGAARLLGATYAVATTGEAGPESASGAPIGTVHLAVAGPTGVVGRSLRLPGGRDDVRRATVGHALELLGATLRGGG